MSPSGPGPVVLASTSPRRAALLREAAVTFEAVSPPFDDSRVDLADTPPELATEALAYLKAASVAAERDAGIVIGSDTLLRVDGRAVGKAADAAAARVMLKSLIGKTHEAVTGVALIDAASGRCEVFHDTTRVTILNLGDEDLDSYLDSEQWRGKAGGYNLAELADRWCFALEGDPTTVVGLPMERLSDALRRMTGSAPV